MTPLIRPSTEAQLETGGKTLIILIVGVGLLAVGAIGFIWTIQHATDGHPDHMTEYLSVGAMVVGALILPGIFTVLRPVLVFIFPNGIPIPGGRRASDPGAPKP